MKRILTAVLLVMVSCGRMDVDANYVVLTCSTGVCSKAGLNGSLQTVWNENDKLSVFYQGSSCNICADYSGDDGARSGKFRFPAQDITIGGRTLSVYPYRSDNALEGNVISTRIPVQQQYRAGSYDSQSVVLVASAEDDNLQFNYASAVIALRIKSNAADNSSLTSVKLKSIGGEAIAGALSIDMTTPSTTTVAVTDGTDTIEMAPVGDSQIQLGDNAVCYFSVAPCRLSSGYEFELSLADGSSTTVKCTEAVEIDAGNLYYIDTYVTKRVRLVLDFSNKDAFSPAIPSTATKTTDGSVTHSFTNEVDGRTYSFLASSPEGGYYWKSVNSTGCLRFNSPGDWLQLPVIANKRLVRFGATLQQSAAKSFTLSSTAESTGDIMPSTSFKPNEMQYVCLAVLPGSEVYMNMTSNNTQISKIELEYE